MLLSHEHRFIFLKTRKTGGTSLEMLLTQWMGPGDVVTPTNLMDEIERLNHGVAPRNFLSGRFVESPFTFEKLRSIRPMALYDFIREHARPYLQFVEHMPAAQVKKTVPPIIWEHYRKISITRHPYEVAVSLAFFELGNDVLRGLSIERHQLLETIDKVIEAERPSNFDIYAIDGRIVANDIIRHEHFDSDICQLLRALRLPDDAAIPRFKTQFRQDKRPAAEILTPRQKARIRELHAPEFEAFHYAA